MWFSFERLAFTKLHKFLIWTIFLDFKKSVQNFKKVKSYS